MDVDQMRSTCDFNTHRRSADFIHELQSHKQEDEALYMNAIKDKVIKKGRALKQQT